MNASTLCAGAALALCLLPRVSALTISTQVAADSSQSGSGFFRNMTFDWSFPKPAVGPITIDVSYSVTVQGFQLNPFSTPLTWKPSASITSSLGLGTQNDVRPMPTYPPILGSRWLGDSVVIAPGGIFFFETTLTAATVLNVEANAFPGEGDARIFLSLVGGAVPEWGGSSAFGTATFSIADGQNQGASMFLSALAPVTAPDTGKTSALLTLALGFVIAIHRRRNRSLPTL